MHLTGRISEMFKESKFRFTAVHTCTERVHTGREAIDEPARYVWGPLYFISYTLSIKVTMTLKNET